MTLDEDTTNPASYWNQLAADQAAGTFKKCRCGEANPANYDTCHFCQQPLDDHKPHPNTGQAFTPDDNDMEGRYGGILVASLGEDGEAIAVTGSKTAALEAIDSYYREVCGQPNLLDDAGRRLTDAYFALDCGHARFVRRRDGGWNVTECAPSEAGAVEVTWWRGALFGPLPEPYERRGDPTLC